MRVLLYSFILWTFSSTFYGFDGFEEDSERILLFRFKHGLILNDSLVAYPLNDTWYVPASEVFNALGIGVDVFYKVGNAKGFIRKESNEFELDSGNCRYVLGGDSKTYECGKVLKYDYDLYVEINLLAKWLEASFEMQSFKSELIISSKISFPVEDKSNRKKNTKFKSLRSQDKIKDFDHREPSLFGGVVFEQQYSIVKKNTTREASVDSKVAFQLLGFEANYNETRLESSNSEFKELRKLQSSPGFLGIRETRLLNQSSPNYDLVASPKTANGAFFSSYKRHTGSDFSSQTIEGKLKPGWEVELYFLGLLIDRIEADSTGRYLFKDVPVQYGRNLYRLVFYGPHGEKLEKNISLNISNLFQKKGEWNYSVFAGEDKELTKQYYVKTDIGITKSLNFGLRVLQEKLLADDNEYLYYSASLSNYNEYFSWQWNSFFSNLDRGSANKFQTWSEFFGIRNTIKLIAFDDYKSRFVTTNYSKTPEMDLGLDLTYAFDFYPIRFSLENRSVQFEDDSNKSENNIRVGTYFAGINFDLSHGMVTDTSTSEKSELSANYTNRKSVYRLVASYANGEISRYEASYRYKADRKSSFRLQFSKEALQDIDSIQLSFSKEHKYLGWSVDSFYDSNNEYSLGAYLNYSLASSGFYLPHLRGRSQVNQAFLRVRVFLDENSNGVYDLGEASLPRIKISFNKGVDKYITDENGFVIVDKIPPHIPFTLSIDEVSLPEPHYFPSESSKSFELSTGKIHDLDFPIRALGEVDGFVNGFKNGKQKLLKRVPVIVESKKTSYKKKVLTDTEGYFVFEKLPAGKYDIYIDPGYIADNSYKQGLKAKNFKVSGKGGYLDEIIFNLK